MRLPVVRVTRGGVWSNGDMRSRFKQHHSGLRAEESLAKVDPQRVRRHHNPDFHEYTPNGQTNRVDKGGLKQEVSMAQVDNEIGSENPTCSHKAPTHMNWFIALCLSPLKEDDKEVHSTNDHCVWVRLEEIKLHEARSDVVGGAGFQEVVDAGEKERRLVAVWQEARRRSVDESELCRGSQRGGPDQEHSSTVVYPLLKH
ncbi:hypothetical protein VNO78_08975 [Psophocarpus tetragonolobus]|uniref:Uncharacterized protein n=1 Tax=Psophocarpus tetragonolobus TaxID=3891 RepID=A0AAN9SVL4_PSOTE